MSFAHIDYSLLAGSASTLHVVPAVAAIWSFHFSEQLRLYGAFALGYGFVSYDGEANDYYEDYRFNHLYTELNAGGGYALRDAIALRAELGWHGLRGGFQIRL